MRDVAPVVLISKKKFVIKKAGNFLFLILKTAIVYNDIQI